MWNPYDVIHRILDERVRRKQPWSNKKQQHWIKLICKPTTTRRQLDIIIYNIYTYIQWILAIRESQYLFTMCGQNDFHKPESVEYEWPLLLWTWVLVMMVAWQRHLITESLMMIMMMYYDKDICSEYIGQGMVIWGCNVFLYERLD